MRFPFIRSHQKVKWAIVPEDHVSPYGTFQEHCDLDVLLKIAEESRPLLSEHGQVLANHLNGKFILADNKKNEAAILSIERRGRNSPAALIDYVRGCILVEGIHNLSVARKKIRSIVEYTEQPIRQVKDRCSNPISGGVRGIFLAYALPNRHIAEIQIHEKKYWESLCQNHEQYEQERVLRNKQMQIKRERVVAFHTWRNGGAYTIQDDWDDATRSLQRAEKKTRQKFLDNIAAESGLDKFDHLTGEFNQNCSFPLRPDVMPSGKKGYWIASGNRNVIVTCHNAWEK